MDEDQVMGSLFKKVEQYLVTQPGEIFVEIGTARGVGGSTHFFAELAAKRKCFLHTVDIDNRSDIVKFIPNVSGHWMPGSQWTAEVLPTLDKKISCVYLDNYDYNYWINYPQLVQSQKQQYLEQHGIEMNNTDCQVEHLKQIIGLLPYMSKKSVVVCDDTYRVNDCWIGKCGAVVPYLLVHGFQIVEIEEAHGQSYGVILKRS